MNRVVGAYIVQASFNRHGGRIKVRHIRPLEGTNTSYVAVTPARVDMSFPMFVIVDLNWTMVINHPAMSLKGGQGQPASKAETF